jgi:predicted RNA-binding Zn-ribbon protein involved in translation (DUF1610 family)
MGDECSSCGNWIPDTGSAWVCDECHEPTCERCGRFDHVEEVFLCPECFKKESPKK